MYWLILPLMKEEFNYDTETTIIGAKQHLQNSKIVHTIIVVETLSAFVALLFWLMYTVWFKDGMMMMYCKHCLHS